MYLDDNRLFFIRQRNSLNQKLLYFLGLASRILFRDLICILCYFFIHIFIRSTQFDFFISHLLAIFYGWLIMFLIG
jgi:hypothetical protein